MKIRKLQIRQYTMPWSNKNLCSDLRGSWQLWDRRNGGFVEKQGCRTFPQNLRRHGAGLMYEMEVIKIFETKMEETIKGTLSWKAGELGREEKKNRSKYLQLDSAHAHHADKYMETAGTFKCVRF